MGDQQEHEKGTPPRDAVSELIAIGPGDTTGTETLARYEYQIKVAVLRWLTMLGRDVDAQVLCEYVDDITTITADEIRFAQVKTRDRGSWSVAEVFKDGGGLDALARSYLLAVEQGCHELVALELILEGPGGATKDIRRFFQDPTTATAEERKRVRDLGIQQARVSDFLGRLKITTQYHARGSIDGVTFQALAMLMGGHTADVRATQERLLGRAREAHLGLVVEEAGDIPLALQGDPVGDTARLSRHALTRAQLLTILPPLPLLEVEQRALIEARAEDAVSVSDLEFKLRVAGATDDTVAAAQDKRARTAAALAARASIRDVPADELRELETRVLEYGKAVVSELTTLAPQLAGRTGEVVFQRLIQNRGALSELDDDGRLESGDLVLGLLCELSDRCLFAWRIA